MGWWPDEEMTGLNPRTKVLERESLILPVRGTCLCVYTPVRDICVCICISVCITDWTLSHWGLHSSQGPLSKNRAHFSRLLVMDAVLTYQHSETFL